MGVGFFRLGGFPRAGYAAWWGAECCKSSYWYGKVNWIAGLDAGSYDTGGDTKPCIGEIKRC